MKRTILVVIMSMIVSVAMAQKPAIAPKPSAAKSAQKTAQTKTQQSTPKQQGYVDLDLPSGTLWKSANEKGFYTYDEAMNKYGEQIPEKWQWQELISNCTWTWSGGGYKVVGKNGRSIFLSTNGALNRSRDLIWTDCGFYWSSTIMSTKYDDYAWRLGFSWNDVDMDYGYMDFARSVRLVK